MPIRITRRTPRRVRNTPSTGNNASSSRVEVTEHELVRSNVLVERFLAAIAVETDRRGVDERALPRRLAPDGFDQRAGRIEAAVDKTLLARLRPAAFADVLSGQVDDRVGRGIEVGHIFYFGTKYSEPMRARVAGPDGAVWVGVGP